jgi:hypothetical protein
MLTVIIWAVYLHLFFSSYRRHRRPKILINRGGGASLRAHCIISNMSELPVYVEAVFVRLENEDSTVVCRLSDLAERTDAGPRRSWFQGPLAGGDLMELDTYERLLEIAGGSCSGRTLEPQGLKIIVVLTCAADSRLVGAERSFKLHPEINGHQLEAVSPYTAQIGSTRRGYLERLLKEPPAEPRLRQHSA